MKNKIDTVEVRDTQGNYHLISSEELLNKAKRYASRALSEQTLLTNPMLAADFISTLISHLEHEVFLAIWLDTQHRIISHEQLFRGTIDGASVYPREVVKAALSANAAAVIFAHNHPSGHAEPSQSDIRITERLKAALELVDIRVLDHLVVGKTTVSMAERGLT